jgi:glycosyltransferase involved in cell wall biosynthesis
MVARRRSIAIYYPYFLGGGAEAVCLWMLQALCQDYDLTLYTLGALDWEGMNRFYGTDLGDDRLTVKALLPHFLAPWGNQWVANFPLFRKWVIHGVLRWFKATTQGYDLVMSGYNGADLGRRGIQYIHWIKVLEGGKQNCNWLSQFSLANLQKNISLVNSRSVAESVRSTYGIPSQVVYPPVVIPVSQVSWAEKTDGFICSGRLVAAKSPHRVIEILQQVRQKGYPIHLHLTGGGGGVYAQGYQRFLMDLIAKNKDWITLHQNLSYQAYAELLSTCRYGIHIKQEPFGIAIAEMVKAGILPFVRSEGGQVEIVGEEAALLFSNDGEAVEKIIQVLSRPDLQQATIDRLQQCKALFSADRFCQEIQQVVAQYFGDRPPDFLANPPN